MVDHRIPSWRAKHSLYIDHTPPNNFKMAPKVLFVLTSHDKLGDTGKPTGWYLVSSPLRPSLPRITVPLAVNLPLTFSSPPARVRPPLRSPRRAGPSRRSIPQRRRRTPRPLLRRSLQKRRILHQVPEHKRTTMEEHTQAVRLPWTRQWLRGNLLCRWPRTYVPLLTCHLFGRGDDW